MTGRVVSIDPRRPDPAALAPALNALRTGGCVGFPTHSLYGIAADACNETAVRRVFDLKKRPAEKPLSVLIPDAAGLMRLAREIPTDARLLISAFWPGRLTLVLAARTTLPAELTAGSGKIGVRLPAHPVAAALVRRFGGPLTATSANLAGRPGCSRVADFPPELTAALDLILDAGSLEGGSGSTVVDATQIPPRVLREGSVSGADIRRALAAGS